MYIHTSVHLYIYMHTCHDCLPASLCPAMLCPPPAWCSWSRHCICLFKKSNEIHAWWFESSSKRIMRKMRGGDASGRYVKAVWRVMAHCRMGCGQRDGWRVMHTNASEYNGFAGRLDLRCENGPQLFFKHCYFLWTVCGPFCVPP